MSEPSEDEELNYLRTKLLLLGIIVDRVPSDNGEPWYVGSADWPGTFKFRPPYNVFYKTFKEAVEPSIILAMAGADQFGRPEIQI